MIVRNENFVEFYLKQLLGTLSTVYSLFLCSELAQ